MSELQLYYDNFRTGYWAHPEADKCKCRGGGYALSEVDTWHECPYHFVPGQPHPEDWDPDPDWDHEAELAKYKERTKNQDRCPHNPNLSCDHHECSLCTSAPQEIQDSVIVVKPTQSWVEKESPLEFYQGPENEEDLIPF